MNGKKYKVSIRVFDHPQRHCNDWKGQQKMSSPHKDSIQTEKSSLTVDINPVYRSCVQLYVPDKRNKSGQEASCGSGAERNWKPNAPEAICKTINSSMEGMSMGNTLETHSELDRQQHIEKPLIKSMQVTSLNINKLRRNNAVSDEEPYEQRQPLFSDEGPDCGNCGLGLPSQRNKLSPHQRTDLCYLNEETTEKHNIATQLNGFNVDLPTVVVDSERGPLGERYCKIKMNTLDYSMEDDGLASDCFGMESARKSRLNREGSTCSSDSIITEIEGLSDDELVEVKENSTAQEDSNECPQRSTTNWKKIRGMIHWAPFAKSYKKKYPWVQLAGHQGNFKAGESGTILKKTNDVEKDCLIKLMKDDLQPYVPEFKREVENHEERYLVMEDLLSGFDCPSVMDCKMGVRTFLEDELEKARQQPKLRKDLYQKMIDVDPNAPTEVEREAGAITKPRYMKWREELSSSASLGFRIEGIKRSGEKPNKDFKTTRSIDEVGEKFKHFINNDANAKLKYLQRLKNIRSILESSHFFKIHEVIGSSLLFVHDARGNVNVWMIDFAKTKRVADGLQLNHRDKWKEGNHEDGYLFGLDNMISIWSNL